MKTKNLLLTSLFLLTAASLSSCNTTQNETDVLVVGMECAYAPFNWTETSQTDTNVAISNIPGAYAEGYDVQVARIIADELDLELQIKSLSWDALINELNAGSIDAIIAGMSPTPERLESINFTSSYYESTHVMLVNKNSTYAEASSLDDFAGATVIGQTGTIYADLVEQAVEHGAVAGQNLATVPLNVNAVLNGTADATIVEEPVAKGIISQNPNLTYVVLSEGGFVVSDEDRIVSIGVRKDYELTEEINNVLENTLTAQVREQLMTQAIEKAPSDE